MRINNQFAISLIAWPILFAIGCAQQHSPGVSPSADANGYHLEERVNLHPLETTRTATTTFSEKGWDGTSIVVLLDTSASMFGSSLTLAQHEVRSLIFELPPTNAFNVVFFADRTPFFLGESQSLLASPENKKRAYEELEKCAVRGIGLLAPALEAVFRNVPRPDQVYLVTDGDIDDLEDVDAALLQLDPQKKVEFQIIQVVGDQTNRADLQKLKQISGSTKGNFKRVSASDLAK